MNLRVYVGYPNLAYSWFADLSSAEDVKDYLIAIGPNYPSARPRVEVEGDAVYAEDSVECIAEVTGLPLSY